MTRIVLALVCAVLFLASPAWAAEEKRVALVMGVGAYAQLRPPSLRATQGKSVTWQCLLLPHRRTMSKTGVYPP